MIKQETLILNENDIRRIIAEKYDVDDMDVCIEISKGDPQYPQLSVYAKILQS